MVTTVIMMQDIPSQQRSSCSGNKQQRSEQPHKLGHSPGRGVGGMQGPGGKTADKYGADTKQLINTVLSRAVGHAEFMNPSPPHHFGQKKRRT